MRSPWPGRARDGHGAGRSASAERPFVGRTIAASARLMQELPALSRIVTHCDEILTFPASGLRICEPSPGESTGLLEGNSTSTDFGSPSRQAIRVLGEGTSG